MSKLSHLDERGNASMVDVSAKSVTERTATAEARIKISQGAFQQVMDGTLPKGDVVATARIAGIMAAKRTSELIPLCHPLALTHAGIEIEALPDGRTLRITSTARTSGQTGVEMEALTAASVAALTVYDMVKAVDKSAVIESIRLLTKSGGKSGTYEAAPEEPPKSPPAKRGSSRLAPQILSHETAPAGRARQMADGRENLRQFMIARGLRPTEWAQSASVPLNELYGYLSGHSPKISPRSIEKLAKAAKSTPEEMLSGKTTR
jgi:cyclic pyranopterin monophosphate synthase